MSRTSRRPPTLFAQIALRLALLTVVFVLLDVGMVVLNYLHDEQVLAEDFVDHQADRIARAWHGTPMRLTRPTGVSAWAYGVAGDGNLAVEGDRVLAAELPRPAPSAIDRIWRDQAPMGGVRITGIQQFQTDAGPRWALVVAETRDWRFYLPVIAHELVDHVAEPLVPLVLLLFGFNVIVVRRVLAPLTAVVDQVDSFAPSQMDARLADPGRSREVSALVAALNRALDRLQAAMRLLKDFTADAAHELRTPLAVLQMRVETLPDGEDKARLQRDVEALARLVNQMLDQSQADALSLDRAVEIDLVAVARDTVAAIAPLAFAKDRDVRLVDAGAGPVLGHADALGRALRNLVENAIAHAPGDAPIEVIVGPGPRLAVRDHGPGLGAADPERLFRRFWRGRRDGGGGAGLGLAIARSIAQAHGGTLSARNAPDGGAIFTLEFSGAPQAMRPAAV